MREREGRRGEREREKREGASKRGPMRGKDGISPPDQGSDPGPLHWGCRLSHCTTREVLLG